MIELQKLRGLLSRRTPGYLKVRLPDSDFATAKLYSRDDSLLGETTHHGKMCEDALVWVVAVNTLDAFCSLADAAEALLEGEVSTATLQAALGQLRLSLKREGF